MGTLRDGPRLVEEEGSEERGIASDFAPFFDTQFEDTSFGALED